MDIGASTGGFTDCMLQNGAARVYSVDVGYGQFAWSLRTDPRVVCMEKTNVRYLTEKEIPEPLDFASCDVSFISLSKVLPAAYNLLKQGGQMVCLIKPQFEAGKEKVGKKGVVREPSVHREVIAKVVEDVKVIGFTPLGLTFSPVKGPEGNIEYLIWLSKDRAGKSPVPVPDKDGRVAAKDAFGTSAPGSRCRKTPRFSVSALCLRGDLKIIFMRRCKKPTRNWTDEKLSHNHKG